MRKVITIRELSSGNKETRIDGNATEGKATALILLMLYGMALQRERYMGLF